MKSKPLKKGIRPYRNVFSNAIWSFKGMFKGAPMLLVQMALQVPLNIFLAYGAVYLPSLVVGEVTRGESLAHGAWLVGMLLLLMLAADVLMLFLTGLSQSGLTKYRYQKVAELDRKSMDCFYQIYEKKENRDLQDRAQWATVRWNNGLPICDLPRRSLNLVENIGCYCLFGSVIFNVSPWLVPILTVAPLANWFCARLFRKWEYANRGKWADIDRRLEYVKRMPSDFEAAKDIRIYGLAGWFRETYRGLACERLAWEKKLTWGEFLSRIADLMVILLRDGAAYALLIHMTLAGEITVDGFVLYFSAISMFASFVGNIINEWNGMHTSSLNICDYRQYLDLPGDDDVAKAEQKGTGKMGRSAAGQTGQGGMGQAAIEKHLQGAPEITFEHVSFRYEGADENTLKDIHFNIKPGEKIALVGLNGAGKTTLVKLLCGLYRPTGGEILLNGVNIKKYDYEEYMSIFSVVFQDFRLFSFTLGQNVAAGTVYDETLVRQCLEQAGFGERLESMGMGLDTCLYKDCDENGVEISGGEAQKIALARALYKDAPFMILNEPTAALDPVSEYEVFSRFNEIAKDKTAIYISHRLASCRFCDKIAVFDEGRIVQTGSHAELLAQEGGKYYELWHAQAQYYTSEQ